MTATTRRLNPNHRAGVAVRTVQDLVLPNPLKQFPEYASQGDLKPTWFISTDYGALICVSAEDGRGFADYYGEFRGGYPWIHPELEAIAKRFGMHWEWLNPGAIGLYF